MFLYNLPTFKVFCTFCPVGWNLNSLSCIRYLVPFVSYHASCSLVGCIFFVVSIYVFILYLHLYFIYCILILRDGSFPIFWKTNVPFKSDKEKAKNETIVFRFWKTAVFENDPFLTSVNDDLLLTIVNNLWRENTFFGRKSEVMIFVMIKNWHLRQYWKPYLEINCNKNSFFREIIFQNDCFSFKKNLCFFVFTKFKTSDSF